MPIYPKRLHCHNESHQRPSNHDWCPYEVPLHHRRRIRRVLQLLVHVFARHLALNWSLKASCANNGSSSEHGSSVIQAGGSLFGILGHKSSKTITWSSYQYFSQAFTEPISMELTMKDSPLISNIRLDPGNSRMSAMSTPTSSATPLQVLQPTALTS